MAQKPKSKVKCPTCKKPVPKQDNAFLPFCSHQCRLIDLGKWLDGGHAIPGSDSPSMPDDNPENN